MEKDLYEKKLQAFYRACEKNGISYTKDRKSIKNNITIIDENRKFLISNCSNQIEISEVKDTQGIGNKKVSSEKLVASVIANQDVINATTKIVSKPRKKVSGLGKASFKLNALNLPNKIIVGSLQKKIKSSE